MRQLTTAAMIFALPLALSMGCAGSCRKSNPYVPFLEDAGATASKSGDPALADAAVDGGHKSAFQPIRATIPAGAPAKLTLEGLSFEAPAGSGIIAALARDLDGDGQKDVVAYVQPPGGGGGELRFHRGDGGGGLLASRVVGSGEAALPSPCLAKPSPQMLTLVGPHSIALDLRPTCGEAAPASRRFVLAAFAPVPSIRWAARVSEPPAGFTLTIEVEAVDVDGDGIDDPTFVLGLEGGGAPFEAGDRLQARLPYWDRPAGLSRDRKYPELSFQTVAQGATIRAAKKASAPQVAGLVKRLRILHAAICNEAGSPWLEVGGERGIGCGGSKALEDATVAEIKAALALGDPLVANAAREKLGSPALANTKKTRAEVDKLIEGAVPSVWGTARDLKAIPSTPSKGAPAWGALAFDKSGALLVRTATDVVRLDPKTFEEKAIDDTPWPWEVTFPEKDARLASVVDPCDAPYFAARVAGHDVPTGSTLLPLPMIPLMSGSRCSGGSSTVSAVPVAWGPQGLYTLVAREPVIVPSNVAARPSGVLPAPGAPVDGAYVQGSPRSPGGGFLVVPTRFGLLRRDDASGSASYVRVKDLEGLYAAGLRECTIADGGGKLACVRDALPQPKAVLIDTTSAAPPPLPPAGEE
ncbi:MAG: hypothetical protein ACXWVM_24705 [Polyangiales bacterium]